MSARDSRGPAAGTGDRPGGTLLFRPFSVRSILVAPPVRSVLNLYYLLVSILSIRPALLFIPNFAGARHRGESAQPWPR